MPNGGLKNFGGIDQMVTETENDRMQTNTIGDEIVTTTDDYHLTSHNQNAANGPGSAWNTT